MQNSVAVIFYLLAVCLLVSCGNKGDLYLVPDEINEQDIEELQRGMEQSDSVEYEVDDLKNEVSSDINPRSSNADSDIELPNTTKENIEAMVIETETSNAEKGESKDSARKRLLSQDNRSGNRELEESENTEFDKIVIEE